MTQRSPRVRGQKPGHIVWTSHVQADPGIYDRSGERAKGGGKPKECRRNVIAPQLKRANGSKISTRNQGNGTLRKVRMERERLEELMGDEGNNRLKRAGEGGSP